RDFHVTGVQTCALPISDDRAEVARVLGFMEGDHESTVGPQVVQGVPGLPADTCDAVRILASGDGCERSPANCHAGNAACTGDVEVGRASCRESGCASRA